MNANVNHPGQRPAAKSVPTRNPSAGWIPTLAALLIGATALMIGLVSQAAAAPKGSPWDPSYFPNVPMITQDGQAVRFYEHLLKDKMVVINTISTHCAACQADAQTLAQAQRILGDRVGKDIFFYSITSDPEQDTPSVLKAYAEKLQAGPGWLFLTGQRADIELVGTKLGFYALGYPSRLIARSANLAIGNDVTGRWRWRTAADDPEFVALLIDTLLPSGSAGQSRESYADTAPLPTKGQLIFTARCVVCHTIGHGDADGPDLQGVTTRRERGWLARWLAAPDQVLAEGDPTASALRARFNNTEMPNLHLAEHDVAALLAYLETQSAGQ
jgi:protein SCO1